MGLHAPTCSSTNGSHCQFGHIIFPDKPQIYFEGSVPGSHYLSIKVGIIRIKVVYELFRKYVF